jgi:hypothetical protein
MQKHLGEAAFNALIRIYICNAKSEFDMSILCQPRKIWSLTIQWLTVKANHFHKMLF